MRRQHVVTSISATTSLLTRLFSSRYIRGLLTATVHIELTSTLFFSSSARVTSMGAENTMLLLQRKFDGIVFKIPNYGTPTSTSPLLVTLPHTLNQCSPSGMITKSLSLNDRPENVVSPDPLVSLFLVSSSTVVTHLLRLT